MNDEAFYRAFEARFRGSREVISERLRVYLPLILPLVGGGPARALDLGCGRGEWLELLTEAGFDAEGVDLDEGMLSEAKAAGLNVLYKDAVKALRAEADGSLALVSGFHLAEHLPFETLSTLIKEARRVLRPGGRLILETPDAENLRVGTFTFHLDPTHVKPIPSPVMVFLAEYHGFEEAEILHLNAPAPEPEQRLSLWDIIANASADYALIAQVAGPDVPTLILPETPGSITLSQQVNHYDEALAQQFRRLSKRLSRLEVDKSLWQTITEWAGRKYGGKR